MNPIGTTEDGTIVFTASPESVRAAALFAQLEAWHAKKYDPQLHSTPDGWVLLIDQSKWARDINERSREMLLRFVTAPAPTPQAAIEAALQVIQP